MRGEMINEYRKLNSEDQKEFRRWLWANTVVGAILLAGLIALASKLPGDESGATAQNANNAYASQTCASNSDSIGPPLILATGPPAVPRRRAPDAGSPPPRPRASIFFRRAQRAFL